MDSALTKGQLVVPNLVIVGAGPKAAALSTKAHILKKLGFGDINITIVEHNNVAANWIGGFGFTDGKGPLGTIPEKDLGYPYHSKYGLQVDFEMLRYSWQAHLIEETAYSDWVDRGRPNPSQSNWARYLKWAIDNTLSEGVTIGRVEGVVPEGEKLKVQVRSKKGSRSLEADGIVFTGPGEPVIKMDAPTNSEYILDGKNYWQRIEVFEGMKTGRVAIIGGGETAASIAVSLLNKAKNIDIEIINRSGTLFTRGESYREIRPFSNPDDWKQFDEPTRAEFLKRTDRGVFSVNAQKQIDRAENITPILGQVDKIEVFGNKVIVRLERGEVLISEEYDKVIIATGFDPWSWLQVFPEQFRPLTNTKELQRQVDEHLRVPFGSAPGLPGAKINVHMPMVAGLAQGPGFPLLLCLGHMADRILSCYIPTTKQQKGAPNP